MKPSNRLTPYPVLSEVRDDYVEASFRTTIEAMNQFSELVLRIGMDLDEPALKDLISQGKAAYAIHVESPSSSFRKCITTHETLMSITLDRTRVSKVVEVCTFIVACETIKSFMSPHFHPDYEGMSFDIDPGAVLAVGSCQQIEIKSNEDLERHESVFRVRPAPPSQRDALAINTDGNENVLVSLRPDLYHIYAQVGTGPDADLILSLVMMPALAAVLTRMMDAGEDSDDSEKEWFRSIREILEKNDVKLSDLDNYSESMSALAIAQRVFGQPVERALKGLAEEK